MSGRLALVTGANGWLGKRLLEALARDGWRLRCLVEKDDPAPLLDALGADIRRGDIRDEAARTDFLRNAEGATLFHLAGIIHPRGVTRSFEAINHRAAIALIDASRGLARAVVMSSNSPLGCNASPDGTFDENSPYSPYMGYGRSKMRLEQDLRRRIAEKIAPDIVIVRAPWFYGPGQPPRQTLFFKLIREGRMPIFGTGLNKRSMAYTDSLAQGLVLAATNISAAGEIFWIADSRPYPMQEIVDTVGAVLENDFRLCVVRKAPHVPGVIADCARLADFSLQRLGLYNQKIHVLSEMNQTIACSIAKAESILGYRPLVGLREGMRRSIEWCLEQGQKI